MRPEISRRVAAPETLPALVHALAEALGDLPAAATEATTRRDIALQQATQLLSELIPKWQRTAAINSGGGGGAPADAARLDARSDTTPRTRGLPALLLTPPYCCSRC